MTKVDRFAMAMSDQLDRNSYKGGWTGCTTEFLSTQIRLKLDQISSILDNPESQPNLRQSLLVKTADIANYALMLADNQGALIED